MPRTPRPSTTPRRLASRLTRSLALLLLATVATACNRHIEEDPPIPEHRIAPCETWCAMMFDPVCPAAEVEVPTEEECVENCSEEEGIWCPVDGVDECAATYVANVECLAALPCDELQGHFDAPVLTPVVEWSSCGAMTQAQLDCQAAHY